MGGGKGKAPPPPDYAAISAANKEAAEVAASVQREQLAWAKEQYAMDRADNKAINDVFIDQMKLQSQISKEDRERYQTQYQPLEDKLIKEANEYDTEERRTAEAGRQVASVDQMFEASRNAAEAQAISYGIDPGQMRAGALDLGSRLQEATAKAGAAYQGRTQVENTGRALRSEALNIGKGYPGQYSQASALTGQMGQNAVNTNLATTASGAATMGTGAQWAGIQNQALGNWGNYAANIYGSQMQYKAAMAGNSPWSAIGKLAGTAIGGWASGGFKVARGGAIPDGSSPSGGAIPDDVHAMVTPGEYVIPNWLVDRTGGPEAWDAFVRGHGGDPAVDTGGRRMPMRRADGGAVDPARPNMAYPQGEPQFQIQPGEDWSSYMTRMRHLDQAEMADEDQLHQRFWDNRFDTMQGRGAPDARQMDDLYQDWQRGSVDRPGMAPVMRSSGGRVPDQPPAPEPPPATPTPLIENQLESWTGSREQPRMPPGRYYEMEPRNPPPWTPPPGRYYEPRSEINRAQGGAIPEQPQDGSYNIPFDVAHRMGTEKLDKLVEKTRNPQAAKGKGRRPQQQEQADPQQMQELMGMMIPPRGGAIPVPYSRG